MAHEGTNRGRVLGYLAQVAPGTPLRDGFERILRGRTGALVVMGHTREVQDLCTGGFELNVGFTATALRELAKMDGAIVLESDSHRIVRAGVQLMPAATIPTAETGTRHRTADRVARQTGVPVIAVSSSMATISLYVDAYRQFVEHPDQILSRANQALQTLERYRARLREVTVRLSGLEVQDQVTVRDVAAVAQRLEMVQRLDAELAEYVAELGSEGRLLVLQLHELTTGLPELAELVERDYRPDGNDGGDGTFGQSRLADLDSGQLLDLALVARTVGFATTDLDVRITPRGYRQVAQIHRLPRALGERLIEHFGSLQALFAASGSDLQEVEGVGEQRARAIRNGLVRVAESAYADPSPD
ncbi:MAG: DNA integrity scanning diadenylate cyclase DisA [Microlunatus sp.]|nr:DNA integrity scanning diadenylate cyclase DisA [Microlunatus sp.]MDN5771810.1 DNA integrity scanning diadenylate cyclase DisA [Microlunatus sp.]